MKKFLNDFHISPEGSRKSEDRRKELEREVSELNRGNRKLDNENGRLKHENGQLMHENGRLKHEIERLKDDIHSLNNRLEIATRKKPVQVYLYAPSMNEKISTAVRSELQIILMGHLEATKGRQLDIVYTSDAKSVSFNKPLIVLCINASRLGTDVEQALQQVNCSKSVTVAVIHHKELHALPPQTSEKLLYGDKFRDLYAIVDIAFLTSKGMYTCDMNNKALERLTEFICQFDT